MNTSTLSSVYFKGLFLGYLACALSTCNDSSDEQGGNPLDQNYSRSDIAFGTAISLARECHDFLKANEADLAEFCECGKQNLSMSRNDILWCPTFDRKRRRRVRSRPVTTECRSLLSPHVSTARRGYGL